MGASAPDFFMAVIYLKHPVHGAKVATMDLEAEFDEMHGWSRYDPYDDDPPPLPVRTKRKYTRAVDVADAEGD